jgi:hypothetical protein
MSDHLPGASLGVHERSADKARTHARLAGHVHVVGVAGMPRVHDVLDDA